MAGWRTGRLPAPPLELIDGGPAVTLSRRLWIDTDAACGDTPKTDPDDCLAIAWLFAKGQDIAGISTSFGNASADVVARTVRVLGETRQDRGMSSIPVWQGAMAPIEKEKYLQPAHKALRAALEQGPLTILALGPLTDIALTLEDRPDLRRNVVRLVAVMGHRPGHIFHPSEASGRGTLLGHGPIFRDLNFGKDPAAASSVLRMQLPITLLPYDLARHVHITGQDLDRISRQGPAFEWAASRSRSWLSYWQDQIGQRGFYPFDWMAAAYAIAPGLFDCAETNAWIANEWMFWLYPRPALLVGPDASVPQDYPARCRLPCCDLGRIGFWFGHS